MDILASNFGIKENGSRLSLDFIYSDDPTQIDNGIRETIKGIRLSGLAIGLGLVRIKSKRLFIRLGHKNMSKYIEGLSEDTRIERSSIFNWLSIGETYVRHKNDLETIGFSDSDGPTKLPYLERALSVREKQDVFDNIKSMTLREFINYSKGEPKKPDTDAPYIYNKGSVVYIEGKRAVIINKALDRKVSAYINKIVKVACEALEKEGYIVPVFVQTRKDARRFSQAAGRLKIKLGMAQ